MPHNSMLTEISPESGVDLAPPAVVIFFLLVKSKLGCGSMILTITCVLRACANQREKWCHEISDLPFQVNGSIFNEAPNCVAQEAPASRKLCVLEELPTMFEIRPTAHLQTRADAECKVAVYHEKHET